MPDNENLLGPGNQRRIQDIAPNQLLPKDLEHPDGTLLVGPEVLEIGRWSVILEAGENVLKIPYIENIERARLKGRNTDLQHAINEGKFELLLHEVSNLERLGGHPGIIQPIRADNHGILMPRYRQGNLGDFMRVNENRPSSDIALGWVQGIADAMCFGHSRGIMWDDVHPRNVLLSDENQLVLIDFANSPAFASGTNLDEAIDSYSSMQTEIFYFGCLAFSILRWEHYMYDLAGTVPVLAPDEIMPNNGPPGVESMMWPKLDEMPSTENIPMEHVIRQCWSKNAYRNMEMVREDIMRSLATARQAQ